jgi:hypothetical protein
VLSLERKNPQELVRGFSEKLEFLMLSFEHEYESWFFWIFGYSVTSSVLDRANLVQGQLLKKSKDPRFLS